MPVQENADQLPTSAISAETWLEYYRHHLREGDFSAAIVLRHNFYAAHKVNEEQWAEVDREIKDLIDIGIKYQLREI